MPTPITLSSYGAIPDMRQTGNTAAITNGSTTLTITGAGFTPADIGKTVIVGTQTVDRYIGTITAIISAAQVTMDTAAAHTKTGTGASWGTNCVVELQAALDDLATSGGGQLLIDGHYLMAGTVVANFSTVATQITIVGMGSNSAFAVSSGKTETAFTITNMARLIFREVQFAGTPNQGQDMARLFDFNACNVSFQDCGFFGFAHILPTNALVYHDSCQFEMVNCHVGGCMTSSGQGTSVIKSVNWVGLHITGTRFIDYGQFNNILMSKSGFAACFSWIDIGATISDAGVNAIQQGVARLTDNRFDENVAYAVTSIPSGGKKVGRIFIDGAELNVTNIAGGAGFYIRNARNVEIRRCSFGWATSSLHDAVNIANCTNVVVDSCMATASATRITAANIDRLRISNSSTITTRTLSSIGQYTQGDKARRILPNIAGGTIAAGAYYDYTLTGIDCTLAAVIVSQIGNGESGAADKPLTGHRVLNRTATGCTVRIYNFGATAQTIDVIIEITN